MTAEITSASFIVLLMCLCFREATFTYAIMALEKRCRVHLHLPFGVCERLLST